jgi:N-acetylglucosamine kinase-like BadF-type ATPase
MIFVGIDAGGTRSRCIAVSVDGTPIARAEGPGSNVHHHGAVEAANRVIALVREALAGTSSVVGQVHAAVCAAGLDTEETANALAAALHHVAPEIVWRLENDAVAAWKGAFGARPRGVVAVSGTGAVAHARNDGREARAGGWGAALGDEGSGYDIGRRALIALLRQHDGMGARTSLHGPVLSHLGLNGLEAIIDHVHFDMQPSHVAALAPLVLEHAQHGDLVAVSIVDGVVESLVEIAAAAASAVRTEVGQQIPLSLVGGVSASAYFSERVRERCAEPALAIPWHPVESAPVIGAVRLAMEAAGTSRAVSSELTHNHIGWC